MKKANHELQYQYIIYASRDGIGEVADAHPFRGRLWWTNGRQKLDGEGRAGHFEKTIRRLVENSDITPIILTDPEICAETKPPYYPGHVLKVVIVAKKIVK